MEDDKNLKQEVNTQDYTIGDVINILGVEEAYRVIDIIEVDGKKHYSIELIKED